MHRTLVLLLACLSLLAVSSLAAADLLPAEMDRLRQEGYQALFNMDYTQARSKFEKMTELDPNHPAGYAYLANCVWLGHLGTLRRLQTSVYNRSSAFFTKTEDQYDPKVDKEFKTALNTSIALSEKRLKADKKDQVGLYYLGIAKNTLASYEATVTRSFFSALRNGSAGVNMHRKLIEINPRFIDANLSIGMYNYVVGSLPLAVKILVFFGGVRGSKKDGIRQLEQVAQEGNLSRDEAAVLLVMLYDREKRYSDSLKYLEEQGKKYPGNFFYRLQTGTTLAELRRFEESSRVFDSMLQDPAAMEYMPDLIHYQYGETLADARSWQAAVDHYTKAAESPKAPEGLIVLAHLESGKCLDAMGKRENALKEYRFVLNQKEVLDSHDQAKDLIKKPFVPESR